MRLRNSQIAISLRNSRVSLHYMFDLVTVGKYNLALLVSVFGSTSLVTASLPGVADFGHEQ